MRVVCFIKSKADGDGFVIDRSVREIEEFVYNVDAGEAKMFSGNYVYTADIPGDISTKALDMIQDILLADGKIELRKSLVFNCERVGD